MTICLDTNAYSKMPLPGGTQTRALIEQADQALVPAIVPGELAAGFRMGSKTEANFRILEEFLDEAVSRRVAMGG